ncbi:MAG: GntR family transcriptional regulator [Sporolactobacillus sp.]
MDEQLYLDISEFLTNQIKSGNYRMGEKLPSENTLCQMFATNHAVVRQAIQCLINRGWITSYQGRGSYVNSIAKPIPYILSPHTGFSENLKEQGVLHENRLLNWKKRVPHPEERQKLQLGTHDLVYELQILRFINQTPAAVSLSVIAEKKVPQLSDYLEDFRSLYSILAVKFKIRPVRRRSLIDAIVPERREAVILQLPESLPLIRIESLSAHPDGSPLEICISKIRSDRCRYLIDFN